MKRHFKDVGIYLINDSQPESGITLKFWSGTLDFDLTMDRLMAETLAEQIKNVFAYDLVRAQSRRDIFK